MKLYSLSVSSLTRRKESVCHQTLFNKSQCKGNKRTYEQETTTHPKMCEYTVTVHTCCHERGKTDVCWRKVQNQGQIYECRAYLEHRKYVQHVCEICKSYRLQEEGPEPTKCCNVMWVVLQDRQTSQRRENRYSNCLRILDPELLSLQWVVLRDRYHKGEKRTAAVITFRL